MHEIIDWKLINDAYTLTGNLQFNKENKTFESNEYKFQLIKTKIVVFNGPYEILLENGNPITYKNYKEERTNQESTIFQTKDFSKQFSDIGILTKNEEFTNQIEFKVKIWFSISNSPKKLHFPNNFFEFNLKEFKRLSHGLRNVLQRNNMTTNVYNRQSDIFNEDYFIEDTENGGFVEKYSYSQIIRTYGKFIQLFTFFIYLLIIKTIVKILNMNEGERNQFCYSIREFPHKIKVKFSNDCQYFIIKESVNVIVHTALLKGYNDIGKFEEIAKSYNLNDFYNV